MASFVSTKTYRPGRSEEGSFSTFLNTEALVVSIFKTRHNCSLRPAKRKFISCPGCLIWKLGIYGEVSVSSFGYE